MFGQLNILISPIQQLSLIKQYARAAHPWDSQRGTVLRTALPSMWGTSDTKTGGQWIHRPPWITAKHIFYKNLNVVYLNQIDQPLQLEKHVIGMARYGTT